MCFEPGESCCSCSETCRCCSECCSGCCECCSMFCLSYMHWISFVRAIFLTIHTLIIGFSIFGMIWANVYFEHFDKAFSGSYIGGHLATLSAGGLMFGLSGLYSAIKHHRRLLYAHCVLTWSSVALRGFTWLLAMLHDYPIEGYVFAIAPLELALALLSTILLRDATIYF